MIPYAPVPPKSLGQLSALTAGLTSGLAKEIVDGAEPVVRRVVRDERNRLAEALTGGVVFGGISALAYIGTRYLVPEGSKKGKLVGYGVSAASATVGGIWTFYKLTETPGAPAPTVPAGQTPGSLDPVIQKAAQDLVTAAEPKVRAIVEDEKVKAIAAAQAAIPFGVGSIAAFLATMFLVKPEKKTLKAVGYSGAALLLGIGAWIGLDKEMEAVTAQ